MFYSKTREKLKNLWSPDFSALHFKDVIKCVKYVKMDDDMRKYLQTPHEDSEISAPESTFVAY